MREYKITKGNLGYHVYRKKEIWKIIRLEWLQRNSYTIHKQFARTFYHLSDAISALVIERAKCQTDTTSREKLDTEDITEE